MSVLATHLFQSLLVLLQHYFYFDVDLAWQEVHTIPTQPQYFPFIRLCE